jgi:hypothetical protein
MSSANQGKEARFGLRCRSQHNPLTIRSPRVAHHIESAIVVIQIQQVNEAYERVLKGNVRFRFVIDLGSMK